MVVVDGCRTLLDLGDAVVAGAVDLSVLERLVCERERLVARLAQSGALDDEESRALRAVLDADPSVLAALEGELARLRERLTLLVEARRSLAVYRSGEEPSGRLIERTG